MTRQSNGREVDLQLVAPTAVQTAAAAPYRFLPAEGIALAQSL